MGSQPSYRPLEKSDFFPDERSGRPLLPNTVARGHLETDRALFVGQNGTPAEGVTAPEVRTSDRDGVYPPLPAKPYVAEFPFPITREALERGRKRYNVFCVPCHDPLGTADGVVIDRGFTRPPSFHNKRLRDAPVGYLYGVVSHGVGSMPDYSSQVLPEQRWQIVAYLRVLQLSQNAQIEDLSPKDRDEVLLKLQPQAPKQEDRRERQ